MKKFYLLFTLFSLLGAESLLAHPGHQDSVVAELAHSWAEPFQILLLVLLAGLVWYHARNLRKK